LKKVGVQEGRRGVVNKIKTLKFEKGGGA